MRVITVTSVSLVLLLTTAGGALSEGKHKGFGSDSGQGNLQNENVQDPPNPGTASVSGPKGQLKQGNTDCNNCEQDLPGRNR
jgi:hypothetical protein